MNRAIFLIIVLLFMSAPDTLHAATYYVDSQKGNDSNSGLSPDYAWKSLYRVNDCKYGGGDSVLFKRGGVWRSQPLKVVCGDSEKKSYVTYGAYGAGPKPLFLGSELRNVLGWRYEKKGVWSTTPRISGPEGIKNPSFATDMNRWYFYAGENAAASAARETSLHYSSPASCAIKCNAQGRIASDMQFFTTDLAISQAQYYRFSFYARATQDFKIDGVELMQHGAPWDTYYSSKSVLKMQIGREWQFYQVFFKANKDTKNARITVYLGKSMPAGTVLYIDDISFKKVDDILPSDIGNLIMNKETQVGVKVPYESDLNSQGRFWYDGVGCRVKMYSVTNPAFYYHDIEFAQKDRWYTHNKSYVIFENMAFKYYGSFVFAGISWNHVIIRDCDFAYIGGSYQYDDLDVPAELKFVRYGNAIEVGGSANDVMIERNFIDNVYDAALTAQGICEDYTYIDNVRFQNNIITNCEYSFELWERPFIGGFVSNVYFENNTCLYAGYGWGHNQRPDPNGRHLSFFNHEVPTGSIFIRNNIFFEATDSAIRMDTRWADIENLILDNNLYYQSNGSLVTWLNGVDYGLEEFSKYQKDTGKDMHSFVADPLFINKDNRNYNIKNNSPCIDRGYDNGMADDFDMQKRRSGNGIDIGAYEYSPPKALWHMNEDGGAIIYDSSGNKNDGMLSGAFRMYWIGGNNLLGFDGCDDSASVPAIKCEEVSVSAWFYKASNDPINADAIFGGWSWNPDVQLQEGFDLRFFQLSPDTLNFILVTQDANGLKSSLVCYYNFGYSVGKMHHVAGVYSRKTGEQKLYIDGCLVDVRLHPAGNTIVNMTAFPDMKIGYSRINNGYFHGLIDEVAIYDRALKSDEVKDLFNGYCNNM